MEKMIRGMDDLGRIALPRVMRESIGLQCGFDAPMYKFNIEICEDGDTGEKGFFIYPIKSE